MLVYRHRMSPVDVDDVISATVVDYMTRKTPSNDGLFLVVADRRACDLLRQRMRETSLDGYEPTTPVDRENLERDLLERAIRRYAAENGNRNAERLLGVARLLFEGASFADACREGGIPRGSQSRYRRTLVGFLERLERRP